MRILSSIISSFWNTVTFMDKEQRALVAHVLTVSQAHPKSFSFRNGAWRSDGMKVTYTQAQKNVNLSGVFYELGWRANAILARHFAMLHICLHHEHIGRALSEVDKSENYSKDAHKKEVVNTYDNHQTVGDIKLPMTIDLAKYVGKNYYVEMSNGDKGNCYVNHLQTEDAVLLLDFDKLFNRQGSYVDGSLHVTLIRELEGSFRGCTKTDGVINPVDNFKKVDLANYFGSHVAITMMDGTEHIGEVGKNQHGIYSIIDCFIPSHHYLEDIVKIEYTDGNPAGSQWITDINLTKWIGKIVDVKLRNGTIVDAVNVNHSAGKTLYQVKVEHVSYTRWGKFWHDRLDGRDIMAIRPTT